jgi:hypothetical protein
LRSSWSGRAASAPRRRRRTAGGWRARCGAAPRPGGRPRSAGRRAPAAPGGPPAQSSAPDHHPAPRSAAASVPDRSRPEVAAAAYHPGPPRLHRVPKRSQDMVRRPRTGPLALPAPTLTVGVPDPIAGSPGRCLVPAAPCHGSGGWWTRGSRPSPACGAKRDPDQAAEQHLALHQVEPVEKAQDLGAACGTRSVRWPAGTRRGPCRRAGTRIPGAVGDDQVAARRHGIPEPSDDPDGGPPRR